MLIRVQFLRDLRSTEGDQAYARDNEKTARAGLRREAFAYRYSSDHDRDQRRHKRDHHRLGRFDST